MSAAGSNRPWAARRGRGQAGLTLMEVIATLFVAALALVMAANMFVGTGQAADRTRALGSLSASAATGTDEILYQLRGASQVVSSYRFPDNTTCTASPTSIAFYAPGIDVANRDILVGNSDAIAFAYDAENKCIRESLQPNAATSTAASSSRPSHNRFVIARNVSALRFTYYVREQCQATAAGSATYTLGTSYSGTPVVFVNGSQSLGAGKVAFSGTTATVTGVAPGADILFFYPIDPAANPSGLQYVTEVDVALTTSAPVSGDPDRTVTQTCRARLRNVPLPSSGGFSPTTAYDNRL